MEFAADGNGVDRLITSVQSAGIGPGGNVYAELGSTWRAVMADLDQAAHVLGKLLLAVGEDNIVWGTDSIWYGSPQDQIAAFNAFQITPEFQERFGYPELTAERKAKILGLNALRVFGIEQPVTTTCTPAAQGFARAEDPLANRLLGPVSRRDILATFVRDHPWVSVRFELSRVRGRRAGSARRRRPGADVGQTVRPRVEVGEDLGIDAVQRSDAEHRVTCDDGVHLCVRSARSENGCRGRRRDRRLLQRSAVDRV